MIYKIKPLSILVAEDEYYQKNKIDSTITNYYIDIEFDEKDERYKTLKKEINQLSLNENAEYSMCYIQLSVQEDKLTRKRSNYKIKLMYFDKEIMSLNFITDDEKEEIDNFLDKNVYEVLIKKEQNKNSDIQHADKIDVLNKIYSLRAIFNEKLKVNTINLKNVNIKYNLLDKLDYNGDTILSISIFPKDYWGSVICNDVEKYEEAFHFFLSLIPNIKVSKMILQSMLASTTFYIYFDSSIYANEKNFEEVQETIINIIFFLRNSLEKTIQRKAM